VRNQLENYEAQLLQVEEHLLAEIRHENRGASVKDPSMFGSKGMEDAIREQQNILYDLYQQLLFCIRARACGWQLLVAYQDEGYLKQDRWRSIEKSLEVLVEGGKLLMDTDKFMRQKVKSMSAFWNREVTVNSRKLELLEWSDKLVTEVTRFRDQIAGDLRSAEAILIDQRKPVTMLVKVENNQIVAACSV
jgi:hypothetical protein